MKRVMLRPTIVFLPRSPETACRCGAPGLDEPCPSCERGVCQECAVFVDPDSRQPMRPSALLAKGYQPGILAHRGCLEADAASLVSCFTSKDVAYLLRILKKRPNSLGRRIV